MTADKNVANAYTTDAIFLGDDALDIVYYIEVDGVKKDIETSAGVTVRKDTYLSYTRDKFTGRMVCIPGTFPGKSWDAASNIMTTWERGYIPIHLKMFRRQITSTRLRWVTGAKTMEQAVL